MAESRSRRRLRNVLDYSKLNALSSVVLYHTSKRKKTGKKYLESTFGKSFFEVRFALHVVETTQYCAKVMLTKFAKYRVLFLRYFADISEIYRSDCHRMKTIIRRYLNDISQRFRSGDNSP